MGAGTPASASVWLLIALCAPLLLAVLWRAAGRQLRLSRAATFRAISVTAIIAYVIGVTWIAGGVDPRHGAGAALLQLAGIVALASGAILLVNPSNRMRARLKLLLVKHLFQHRYDYRAEWLRFTETMGLPGEDAPPLDERVVKAIADMTGSAGGLLLLPRDGGALEAGARWNWTAIDPPSDAGDAELADRLRLGGRIVALDEVRNGRDRQPLPGWIAAADDAWALVPLVHIDRLVGVVVLRRPTVDRAIDWEDFDLLRVAGRQVASYLAEARGQEALSEARRFDEFNRRFAFIMHDIKNLVSQLGLVARNAERHADNPDFRADMIATLHESTAKMNDLLARLSQHQRVRPEEPRPITIGVVVDAVAVAKRRLHPIRTDAVDAIVMADPVRLDQALGHLVQNAIDASGPAQDVWIRTRRRGIEAVIDVIDHGHGMSSEFVRTRLFTPFASTKPGGFGIGAFEARALIQAMGGRLEVESREGEGSRFTIILPIATREETGTSIARVA